MLIVYSTSINGRWNGCNNTGTGTFEFSSFIGSVEGPWLYSICLLFMLEPICQMKSNKQNPVGREVKGNRSPILPFDLL